MKARSAQRLGKARRDAPRIEVSWGELVDRYTIIELKLANDKEPHRTGSLKAEFANLQREMDWFLESIPGADVFYKRMNLVNSRLWRLENSVRVLIRAGDTGNDFIRTARSITLTNEKRSALKSAINKVAATGIEEVKIYHLLRTVMRTSSVRPSGNRRSDRLRCHSGATDHRGNAESCSAPARSSRGFIRSAASVCRSCPLIRCGLSSHALSAATRGLLLSWRTARRSSALRPRIVFSTA